MGETKKIGYKDVLTQKEYMKEVVANLISRFGDSIDAIAFTWLVYALTKDPAWSAIIFALNMTPTVFLQPFAGALVEGMNKKIVTIVGDLIRGICVVILAVSYAMGVATPALLVVLTLVISSVEAFCIPASMALIPKILDTEYYEFGTSMNNTLSTIMQMAGMAMAGVVIGLGGPQLALAIDAGTFLISAILRSWIKVKEEHKKIELNVKAYMQELKSGVLYVKNKKVVCNLIIMAILANTMIIPLNALETPLIVEVLHQTSELLSVSNIILLAGLGLGSLAYPFLARKFSPKLMLAMNGIVVGLALVLYPMGYYWREQVVLVYASTALAAFLVGIAAAIINATASVQFMKCVEEEYMARAGALFSACACASNPIVSAMIGAVAKIVSIQNLFIGFGLGCVAVFVIILLSKVQYEEKELTNAEEETKLTIAN